MKEEKYKDKEVTRYSLLVVIDQWISGLKFLLHCPAMATSEKFCLRWNDFRENVNTAFVDLRKDTDLTDVTLACEDGHSGSIQSILPEPAEN